MADKYQNEERGQDGEARYFEGASLWYPGYVVSINFPAGAGALH